MSSYNHTFYTRLNDGRLVAVHEEGYEDNSYQARGYDDWHKETLTIVDEIPVGGEFREISQEWLSRITDDLNKR